jgi:ABC-type nickel/cobalt efflux system permease component RcnA
VTRRALVAAVAVALALLVPVAVLAQNPIRGGGAGPGPELYDGPVPRFIVDWSRALQRAIASLSRRVVAGEWTAAVSAFALSVVFGIVHIAGPGHGKVFAVSYFSGRPAHARDGIVYSALVNAVDSVSAFAVVMVGYVALRAILPDAPDQAPRVLQIVGYGLIVVFGVAHLLSHLRGAHEHAHPDEAHGHGGRAKDGGADGGRAARGRPAWALALSVGLVPCPVSTILLVYGVANDVVPLMVLMVVGVSLGGFLTMSLIAVAVITGRSSVLGALDAPVASRLATVLEYTASTAIIAIGVVLLLAAM